MTKQWWGILLALTLIAFAVRWYRLPDNLFFGFEQGRDFLRVEQISQLKDFVLVGPKTDMAGIFHGVWYYYLLVLPFLVSGGSPLFAAACLVAMSSVTPAIMFLLLSDITGQKKWGVVAGVISMFSYELVIYSRWLSNVTLAVPCMALSLWAVWRYQVTGRQHFILLATLSAAMAAQFEIILCLWFVFFFGGWWLSRQIQWPSWKTWIGIGVGVGILFAPMLLFNLRNEFISVTTVLHFGETEAADGGPLLSTVMAYGSMLRRLVEKTLFNLPTWAMLSGLLLVVVGNVVSSKDSALRKASRLFSFWSLMSLPVIFFPSSLNLIQLYVGTGLGLIGLATIALYRFSQLKWGMIPLGVLATLLIWSGGRSLYLLHTNQDVFFITIQDDLRYSDQQALLEYVHTDAAGAPYRLKSFSIPYYQEEGWQYLHHFWYPDATELGAQVIYVVIEKAVDPYWIDQWTKDLGPTTLVDEKSFGLLRVQKRIIDQKD